MKKTKNSLSLEKPHLKEVASGAIQLKAADGPQSLVKKALFCRTGVFEGMYGPVTVDVELLNGIAERYNRIKAKAQNANDYAPILTDHIREVDRIKGRALPGLVVEPWTNPETGTEEMGLFGDLRIDDQEAMDKVANGQYAHLSISFDEDTYEFYEISFVAVEAAKGSIVLSNKSQGGKMSLQKKLASATARHHALAAAVATSRKGRKASLARLIARKNETVKEIQDLMSKADAIALSAKVGQIKGQFAEFVRAGKMSPVELAGQDFSEMARMSQNQMKILLSAFEQRQVSSDVVQYGVKAEKAITTKDITPDAMRKAIELQRAGKKSNVKLAAADEENKKEDDDKKLGADEEDDKKLGEGEDKKEDKPFTMGAEEWKACLEEISGLHTKLSGLMEKLNGIGEETDKLSESDKKEEEEEKKLAAEDEKDLAAEEDKDKNKKDEGAE